jgi:hypothetical protein
MKRLAAWLLLVPLVAIPAASSADSETIVAPAEDPSTQEGFVDDVQRKRLENADKAAKSMQDETKSADEAAPAAEDSEPRP